MGKAFYRKYRSKSFDEVIGQEHITNTLKNALKKKAISHAYLFTGPKGVGKTSIARILAYAINGLDYIEETTHLDIIEIDAASNRRIDEIRDLRDKVHTVPTSAKYKVYIIDEVHMLTREAFNALLKTLEEPPSHAVFILATTEIHKVPETIVSRTQKFTFKPLPDDTVVEHLKFIADKEKIQISDEALKSIAAHGNGSFRDSISMLDQLAGFGKDKVELPDVQLLLGIPADNLISQSVEAVAQNNTLAIFQSVQKIKDQGIDSGQAASSISAKLREQLISDQLVMERGKTLGLLKGLLPLTLTSSDYLSLELVLLEQVNSQATVSETQTKEDLGKSNPTAKPQRSAPEAAHSSTETEQASSKSERRNISFSTDSWLALLNELKTHHNTLYGVLRMAQPHVEKKQLTLLFSFSFHKKQVEAPKNIIILREFAQRHFGLNDISTALVSKKPQQSVNLPPKNLDPDAVASVSNIFGGAELLES